MRKLVVTVSTTAIAVSVLAVWAGPSAASQAPAKKCTPGYKPCLPPASDYDCIGGSGDGPKYTSRVVITGRDIYRLDTDGDGIGCDD
jgi:hypothetical protein